MKKFALVLMALLPLVVLPAMAAAQAPKIEVGTWSGNVVDPGGQRIETTYDVTLKGDTIGIVITAGPHGSFTFNEVKLVDKTLTFWLQPGPRVDCKLNRRDDGAFEGSCTDSDGGNASMLMVPPKKG